MLLKTGPVLVLQGVLKNGRVGPFGQHQDLVAIVKPLHDHGHPPPTGEREYVQKFVHYLLTSDPQLDVLLGPLYELVL